MADAARLALSAALLLFFPALVLARSFVCAGAVEMLAPALAPAKAAARPAAGTRSAVVIFARFADEPAEDSPPLWAEGIFDPQRLGSFSHFYDTMSFGALRVRGEVAPRRYASRHGAEHYLAPESRELGGYSGFAAEILAQADADLDFSRYDSDGPDGVPNSGDDDGVVDAVMIVTQSTPANFLLGPATGMADLGTVELVTEDVGAAGRIRFGARSGTIQRGQTYAEAVGAMCHEYGHLLGLSDLFDAEFLQSADPAGPERDSAGIGAWGLMGWGAQGWNGDDGPNSFSGWSRAALGWTPVTQISRPQQEVRLEPTGAGGGVFRVPVTAHEHFLLEYRTRHGNHYDRNLPAKGLLIWHVVERGVGAQGQPPRTLVDLECADGKWEEAGYPVGTRADPQGGGDNLDYWAHDQEYAVAHGGNLGDATDPYDGVRYTSFTPETNPSSWSEDGGRNIRVEDIRLEGGKAMATVTVAEPAAEIGELRLTDDDGDGVVLAGEPVRVSVTVSNRGGLELEDVRLRLATADPLLEIDAGEIWLDGLKIDESKSSDVVADPLAFRFAADFAGRREARISVQVLEGEGILAEHEVIVGGFSPGLPVASVAIVDTAGNGDGLAQAGEIVTVGLTLDAGVALSGGGYADLLRRASASLRPAAEAGARLVGSAALRLEYSDGAVTTRRAPEYLLASTLRPGDRVPFALSLATSYSTWHDTVEIEVSEGPDASAPRVGFLRFRDETDRVVITLRRDDVLEAGEVEGAQAIVRRQEDSVQVVTVVLEPLLDRFEGSWASAQEGAFVVEAVVEDVSGNAGRSQPQVLWRVRVGSGTPTAGTPWQPVPLPLDLVPVDLIHVEVAPSNGQVVYGTGRQGLWQSRDGGTTWHRQGWMESHRRWTGFLISPVDPFLLYTQGVDPFLSRDGGVTWSRMGLGDVYLWHLDAARRDRLFGADPVPLSLLISEDGGDTWRDTGIPSVSVMVAPDRPNELYSGYPRRWHPESAAFLPAHLYRSTDGGWTWTDWEVGRPFDTWTLDPHQEGRLYAASGDTVFRSDDGGRNWLKASELPEPRSTRIRAVFRILTLEVHPHAPGIILASGELIWRSEDGGESWEDISPSPDEYLGIASVAQDPLDPERLLAVYSGGRGLQPLRSDDGGRTWQEFDAGTTGAAVAVVLFDGAGWLWAGSGSRQESGLAQPRVAVRGQDGRWEARGEMPGEEGTPFTPTIEDLYVDPDGRHLAASFGPSLMLSRDGGRMWRTANTSWNDGRLLLRPSPSEPGVYYYASASYQGLGVWRSPDRGETWEQVFQHERDASLSLSARAFAGLELDPSQSDVLYAALDSSIWRSWDGGVSWDPHHGRLDGTILSLASQARPDFRMFAVTAQGFHRSDDGGQTWSQLSEFEQALTFDSRLRFHPRDPQRMYLAAGHRLLETRDGGIHWSEVGTSLAPHMFFYDVAVDPEDGETLYAGTPWGVYELAAVGTAVEEEHSALPGGFRLGANYPNPFNAETVFPVSLAAKTEVVMAVYNLAGQRVRTLATGSLEAGQHRARWDGRDDAGRAVASGVYVVRLATAGLWQTRKCLLLR